jgi:hypothetical protein
MFHRFLIPCGAVADRHHRSTGSDPGLVGRGAIVAAVWAVLLTFKVRLYA